MADATRTGDTRTVTEVEFALTGAEYPFVAASAAEDCVFELAEIVPRGGGRYAEFFHVGDADPERITALSADLDSLTVSLVSEYENGGFFEFCVDDDCPAVALAELGALPREVVAADGDGRIVAEIPPRRDPGTVVETFLDDMSAVTLNRKCELEDVSSLFPTAGFREVARTELTARQRDVLRAAFEAGYYEWPRQATGEEVAAGLDITSSTFSEHIHAAERKLCAALFETKRDDVGASD